jgi:hypothetical protein
MEDKEDCCSNCESLQKQAAEYKKDNDELMLSLQNTAVDLLTAEKKLKRVESQVRVVKKMNNTYQEQFRQERDNRILLMRTLMRVNPEVLAEIQDQLHDSTNELDKTVANATMWRDRARHLERENALLRQIMEE